MHEVILLDADPETRMLVRALLERDGFRVTEVHDQDHAQDVVRGSKARIVLTTPQAAEAFGPLADHLRATRPDLDVLSPVGYGAALIDGAAEREAVSEFARDSLLLLSVLAEEGTRRPQITERMCRLSELTALKLELSRLQTEACASVAALVGLGPCLAAFRFAGNLQEQPGQGVEAGLGRDLRATLTAASTLRCPYDLRGIIEAVEEHYDGRGRPRGLTGDQIPMPARVIAVAREYSQLLARDVEEVQATEQIRDRAGSVFDPRVVDAFFLALRDENYLQQLESGTTGASVLLIDGDSASLAVSQMRLSAAGFNVSICDDGAKAWDAITGGRPDVVISDTVLPKMDGISLLLKMRRDPSTKDIPVLFTSSRTDATILNKALKLGARDVLAKPVNFDVLVAKLRSLSSDIQVEHRETAGGGLSGDITEMPLADFFQLLQLGRKTVKVTVVSGHGQGEVYFDHGNPIAAFAEGAQGIDAFCQLVSWESGSFGITSAEGAPEVNLHHPLEALLLQSAWEKQQSSGHGSGGHGGGMDADFQFDTAPAYPAEATQLDAYADDPYGASPYGQEDPYGAPASPYGAQEDPYGAQDDPYGAPAEPNPYGAPPPPAGPDDVDFGQSSDHVANPFA